MRLKVSSLLLWCLPALVMCHPDPQDLHSRMEMVFSRQNSGKSLIEKFMGNNYATKPQESDDGVHSYYFYNAEGSSESSEEEEDDHTKPDCVHATKPIVTFFKPDISVVRPHFTVPVKIPGKPGYFHSIHVAIPTVPGDIPIVPLDYVPKPIQIPPIPIDVPIVPSHINNPGTLDEIQKEIHHNIFETHKDIVKPIYEYVKDRTITAEDKEKIVTDTLLKTKKDDEINMKLTQIFPPPTNRPKTHKIHYHTRIVTHSSDGDDYSKSKLSTSRPNGLSYDENEESLNTIKFLSKSDANNPPAPLEMQPNLLLIEDWLDMAKKLYQVLGSSEKRKLYEVNKARVTEAHENMDTDDEVTLKLLNDKYLVAEKVKNDNNKNKIDVRIINNDKKDRNPVGNKHKTAHIKTVNNNEEETTNEENKNIHVVHNVARIVTPLLNPYDDDKNNKEKSVINLNSNNKITKNDTVFNKNTGDNNPSQYIFTKNVTRTETNPEGYVIKKNFTKTTFTVNDKVVDPITTVVKTFNNYNINDVNNDGPIFDVNNPDSTIKTVIKTTKVVNTNKNKDDSSYSTKSTSFDNRLSDSPWLSEPVMMPKLEKPINENFGKTVKLSQLLSPTHISGNTLFTSVDSNSSTGSSKSSIHSVTNSNSASIWDTLLALQPSGTKKTVKSTHINSDSFTNLLSSLFQRALQTGVSHVMKNTST